MKNLFILLLLALGASAASCDNNVVQVRATDILTGVPAPVECDTSFYKAGDTVWVNVHKMNVSRKTHLYTNTVDYRKFVID